MQPIDSRFWQYNVYIRGVSQDLCKFSLDFMPAPKCRIVFKFVIGLWQLATNTADAGSQVRNYVGSGVAECDP